MPLYEYQCKKCQHRFEKIQKVSDPKIRKCPKCRGEVEQVLHAPAVQFKGSGWYVTDYARKGSGESSTGSSDDKKPASSGDSGESKSRKSESKKQAKES